MKRVTSCMILCAALLCNCRCLALDWKALHEQADRTDLRTALMRVDKDPRSVPDLYLLGLVYLETYQPDKAGEVFGRLLSVDPQSVEGIWGKAEVMRRDHRYDQAEDLLVGIIEIDPDFCPAYLSLAYIRFAQARFEDSANYALTVVRKNSRDVDTSTYARAHLIYAGAKGMISYFGGPMSHFINGIIVMPTLREAQEMKPDSPEVLFGFGCYYLLAPRGMGKNIRLAQYYLERLVEDEPLFPDGFARLAQVYKIQGDQKRYEQMLNTALELDPRCELALDIKNGWCRFICPEKKMR
ncbi:MAG TPA: hypothetical protein PLJ26_03930 [Candidatus Omnitrophota bacterium]|nr:hypothetical protein [Candidatus Omnitrophota bacterium]